MIKNYLISAFRSIKRNKFFTLINVFGLSIGITTSILIYLYVTHELSFDKHQSKYSKIYRVVSDEENANKTRHDAITPFLFAPTLRNEVAAPEAITRIIFSEENVFAVDNKRFKNERVIYVEPQLFEIFDVEWISGSPEVFKTPDAAVLTESIAKKMFGSIDVVGKQIKLDGKKFFTINGIVKDPLETSNLPFYVFLSFDGYSWKDLPFNVNSWNTSISGFQTFMTLKSPSDVKGVEKQMNDIYIKNTNNPETTKKYRLQPLSDVRTNSLYGESNLNGFSNPTYLVVASLVGLMVLLLGCVNYINLSLAILIKRRKEIGVRKVSGAVSGRIIMQFAFESFLVVFMSLLVAIVLVEFLLPKLANLLKGQIYENVYAQPSIFIFMLILLIVLTIITGVFPSLRVSSIKAVEIFRKNVPSKSRGNFSLQNSLIVFQFTISVILITSTLIILAQLKYIRKKELGFEHKNIITCSIPTNNKDQLSTLRNEVLQLPSVDGVSFALGAPMSGSNARMDYNSPYLDDKVNKVLQLKCVDFKYNEIFGLKLISGRWWNNEQLSDSVFELIVNETFIKEFNFPGNDESIGKEIEFAGNKGIIIGIINDFHSFSLHRPIEPVIFAQIGSLYHTMNVRLKDGFDPKLVNQIKEKWESVYPEHIWEYRFFDDFITEQYKGDDRTYTLSTISAWIAICIALLGLFGISGYTILQKTKYICIRKILGAEVSGLILMLSKRYVALVLLGNAIGLPICYVIMNKWLSNYAYRITIPWHVFAITFVASILLCILVISYYAVKTARENPVNVLRYE